MTVRFELVFAVIPPFVTSDAVTVAVVLACLSVTLKLFVPETSAVSAGRVGFESFEVR